MVKTPLIELHNICKSYGGKDGMPRQEVLRGIDLCIYAGEFVAIIGTSGSGKSTLMHILGCLDKASRGDYFFTGKNISHFSADELAWLRREAFGFVFQSYHLIPTLDANHNIQIPALYAGVDLEKREANADELLRRLGLYERKNHFPHQLSGGQQQRVSIARALINGGYVILADEPTGALDSKSGAEVMTLLKELANSGHTVILITHDAQVAQQAQRVVRICDGRIVEDSQSIPCKTPMSNTSLDMKALMRQMSASVQSNTSWWIDSMEAFNSAWHTLWNNRFRTLLTLLGIIIGVCSVIVLMGVGQGASQKALKQMETFGGVHRVSIWGTVDKITGIEGTISMADVQEVQKIDNVQFVSPYMTKSGVVLKVGNVNLSSSAWFVNAFGLEIFNWKLENGIFFDKNDESSLAKVAVLGKVTKERLFGAQSSIGQYILIDNIPFRVIGELAEIAVDSGESSNDDMVVLPFSTGSRQIAKVVNPKGVQLLIEDLKNIEETVKNIFLALKELRGSENFRIANNPGRIQAQKEANKEQALLITLIASISLVVGGIGIMNIMLMAVKERTKEIGIRMATGARQNDIKRQFLTEAILVSVIGGVIGVIIAFFIATALIALKVEVLFSIRAILLAFCSAVITGLFFGYMPANQASKLDPVVALNGE